MEIIGRGLLRNVSLQFVLEPKKRVRLSLAAGPYRDSGEPLRTVCDRLAPTGRAAGPFAILKLARQFVDDKFRRNKT